MGRKAKGIRYNAGCIFRKVSQIPTGDSTDQGGHQRSDKRDPENCIKN